MAALDALITAGNATSFSSVYTGGRRRVAHGIHWDETAVDLSYRRTVAGLGLP
jgi:hypothetical protein